MSNLIGRVLRVTREIPWDDWRQVELDPRIVPGAIVHEYRGCTYGCLADGEIAVSVESGVPPFYGVPRDAVEDWAPERRVMERLRDRAEECARASALRMIAETDSPEGT